MKKLSLLAAAALVGVCATAKDMEWVSFSSTGPDTYADGVEVLEGEVYALVWVKTGYEFQGFKAEDGSLVDPVNNDVFCRAAIADGTNHRCNGTIYIVTDSAKLEKLGSGSLYVYLLDTRKTDVDDNGVAVSTVAMGNTKVDGKYVVNGCEKIDAVISTSTVVAVDAEKAAGSGETVAAALPADVPDPSVSEISVTDGKVQVVVENTKPYVRYNIFGGETLGTYEPLANGVNGVEGGIIKFILDNPEAKFFRIQRSK